MLVPSTFTGWYRKMMMKAEIASEMIRSRTQTPIPVPRRTAAVGAASGALYPADRTDCGQDISGAPAEGAGAVVCTTGLDSEGASGMSFYCIQNA